MAEPRGCNGQEENKKLSFDNNYWLTIVEVDRGPTPVAMSNVVILPPASAGPGTEPHPALRQRGRWLALLLTGLLVLVAAFAALVLTLGLACGGAWLWLAPGAAYIGAAPTGVTGLVPFGALPQSTRWAYAATFALDTAPVLLILTEARGLALAYGAGIAFSGGGAKPLRRIALWLVAYALAPALGHALVLLAGHGVDLEWLHASALQALVLAACLSTLAEVMRIGRGVERDLDGFV